MKATDMKVGEMYRVIENGSNEMLFIFSGIPKESNNLFSMSHAMYTSTEFFALCNFNASGKRDESSLRECTELEKQWFRACISSAKWVECPKEQNFIFEI